LPQITDWPVHKVEAIDTQNKTEMDGLLVIIWQVQYLSSLTIALTTNQEHHNG
jgi:hypothetical protein